MPLNDKMANTHTYTHTHTEHTHNIVHAILTYMHTKPSSLIYAQMLLHKTPSDIGGPLQKHVS